MKNHLKIAAFAFAMFGFSVVSNAQTTETQTATAEVVKALSFTASSAMDFGKVTPDGTAASTVVLAAGGGATSSDGAQTFGTATPASFTVNGEASAAIAITLPGDTDYTLTNTDGTATGTTTINVTAFTSNAGASPALDVDGNLTFSVGATLNLATDQAGGTYANTAGFDVTVDYQ